MSRTSNAEVLKISDTALTTSQIDNIIEFANRSVTNTLGGEGLTIALLKDIETWLTAHLIAVGKERQPEGEKVGDIWLTYQKKINEGLRSTSYGQMVLSLDTSGKFQQSMKQKVSIRAVKQIQE